MLPIPFSDGTQSRHVFTNDYCCKNKVIVSKRSELDYTLTAFMRLAYHGDIRESVHRDDTGEISRDPRTKRLKTG